MSDDREDRLGRIEAAIAALTTKIAAVTRSLRLAAGGRSSTLYCSFCGKSQHEVGKVGRRPVDLHLQRMHRPLLRDRP